MKIIKCHIENFGKLSNYDKVFEDGLNTIKEENGFGKTTFANFIKAMFYGLDAKRTSKILIDRKKYMPWQGGIFGGNIEFEINGKRYKIERTFGNKLSDDTFKIYDLTTNLESKDYTQNIGEEIFKLNKEAYERSTFISGQKIETAMNDSINAKLGNILENENDINSSDEAINVLDKAIKNYKKTGDRGEISQKINERTKLENKLEESKINEEILNKRKERYNLLKQELLKQEEEREKLNKLIGLKNQEETELAKLENYKNLQKNLEETRSDLNNLQEFFKEGIPSDIELETLIEKCLLIEKYKAEIKNYEDSTSGNSDIQRLKNIFQDKDLTESKINSMISEYNGISETRNKIQMNEEKVAKLKNEKEEAIIKKGKDKTLSIILSVILIISIVLGIGMFVGEKVYFSVGAFAVGIIVLIVMLVKINSFKKKEKIITDKEEEIIELNELIENLRSKEISTRREVMEFIDEFPIEEIEEENDVLIKLTEIKSNFVKYNELANNINAMFEKQKEVIINLQELEDSIKNYLLRYFESINGTYVTYAQEMKMKKMNLEKQKETFLAKTKAIEEYEKENNIEEIRKRQEENQSINKQEIEEKIRIITEQINKLNDEKNYNKNQIELLESNLDTVFDIENSIEELNCQIEEMRQNCDILEKTKECLVTAKAQFSASYLGKMKDGFVKNLKLINGNEMDVNVDVNLKVNVNENGTSKDIEYLSTGYKDLIYICMRLSLIDSLFEKEKPFIILDDPFVNLDENKIKNATNLLKNLSQEYQIVYFICHDSRK